MDSRARFGKKSQVRDGPRLLCGDRVQALAERLMRDPCPSGHHDS